jgi:uncharacterized protein
VINVTATLAPGLTQIVVSGHEDHLVDGRVCAAVSAITGAAIAGLQLIEEQHPEILRVEIKEIP